MENALVQGRFCYGKLTMLKAFISFRSVRLVRVLFCFFISLGLT